MSEHVIIKGELFRIPGYCGSKRWGAFKDAIIYRSEAWAQKAVTHMRVDCDLLKRYDTEKETIRKWRATK